MPFSCIIAFETVCVVVYIKRQLRHLIVRVFRVSSTFSSFFCSDFGMLKPKLLSVILLFVICALL